jgi:ribonuclease PH
LRDLTATFELHRSDAKRLHSDAENQKRRVIEVGGVARQATQAIWSVAHLQRRSNAVEMIRATFDLRKCAITAETLALCDRGYLASRNLEWFFAAPASSIDDRVAALRELPGRFAIVRTLAENTPNLDLAAIFPEPAISELEPALA